MLTLIVVVLACTARSAPAADARIGIVGPNVLVRPADAPVTAAAARLVSARNEFESVQVVLQAGADRLNDVDVRIAGALVGPGGAAIPADALSVYRVGYYDVAGLASDGDLGGVFGQFPDALIPARDAIWGEPRAAFPIDVPARQNRLAWIDVLAPADAPAGTYAGASIHVTLAGVSVASLPISLEIIDATLPSSTTLDGGFDLNPNQVCRAHACSTMPGGGAAVVSMYARIALDNRLSIAKPPNATPSGPGDSSYRTWSRPLLVGTSPARLRGAQLQTVTIYQWAVESADEWRRIAEADGLLDRVRFHCDEIGTSASAWSRCRTDWNRANALWRGAAASPATDLPLQVTTALDDVAWARSNGFGDLVDRIAILVPVINRVHPKGGAGFPGRRDELASWAGGTTVGGASRALWSYTSCMSMGCSPAAADQESLWRGWPSYGIDQHASEARAMGWISWTYDLAGEYYYETARDLPGAWSSQWSSDGGNHGDGTLFYPGTPDRIGGTHDVPLESIRLKRIRDGREDHELLGAAERAIGRPATLAIARSAFADAHSANVSQAAIDGARARLLEVVSGQPMHVEPGPPSASVPVPVPVPPGAATAVPGSEAAAGDGAPAAPAAATPPTSAATASGPAAPAPAPAAPGTPVVDRIPRGTGGTPPSRQPFGSAAGDRPALAGRTIRCAGRVSTIVGTPRNDVLRGTARRDVISGLGGDDIIVGLGAGDVICAGAGRDVIVAGRDARAADLVSCGTGTDRVVHDLRDLLLRDCERRTRGR